MSNEKKSVKRRPRVLEARDLMSVTGGSILSTLTKPTGPTVGMFPQGPRNPSPWDPKDPTIKGPTFGMFPQGPRNPHNDK